MIELNYPNLCTSELHTEIIREKKWLILALRHTVKLVNLVAN